VTVRRRQGDSRQTPWFEPVAGEQPKQHRRRWPWPEASHYGGGLGRREHKGLNVRHECVDVGT